MVATANNILYGSANTDPVLCRADLVRVFPFDPEGLEGVEAGRAEPCGLPSIAESAGEGSV